MSEALPPVRCVLCDACNGIVPARFHLVYPQKDSAPVLLDWWECGTCRGWFVHPVPAPDVISRYWATADWADPAEENAVARAKGALLRRILAELPRWTKPGPLLDFGCNFGQFLIMAREAGWTPSGFEPNVTAAEIARSKGFDVRCGWSLPEAGFTEGYFAAITAIDVFGLVWNPIATLRTLHSLLMPGGILAIRLTNKHFILGFVRALSLSSQSRDTRISQVLLPQFHSIGLAPFSRIMEGVGFDRIRLLPHATTAPWRALSWQTRVAYLGAGMVYLLSLTKINISPGVLLFAQKTPS